MSVSAPRSRSSAGDDWELWHEKMPALRRVAQHVSPVRSALGSAADSERRRRQEREDREAARAMADEVERQSAAISAALQEQDRRRRSEADLSRRVAGLESAAADSRQRLAEVTHLLQDGGGAELRSCLDSVQQRLDGADARAESMRRSTETELRLLGEVQTGGIQRLEQRLDQLESAHASALQRLDRLERLASRTEPDVLLRLERLERLLADRAHAGAGAELPQRAGRVVVGADCVPAAGRAAEVGGATPPRQCRSTPGQAAEIVRATADALLQELLGPASDARRPEPPPRQQQQQPPLQQLQQQRPLHQHLQQQPPLQQPEPPPSESAPTPPPVLRTSAPSVVGLQRLYADLQGDATPPLTPLSVSPSQAALSLSPADRGGPSPPPVLDAALRAEAALKVVSPLRPAAADPLRRRTLTPFAAP
eukprot:TRINITY_DN9984_c0_g1_i1.p1 TRINITY_DN9984_c0_g1~~TRINITY_DN9984_c0_g1_i1.p1  ORF type:complete len:438 (+),score=182.18 TRINITY_DN9984_c0_g1_i1:41-1315(+)